MGKHGEARVAFICFDNESKTAQNVFFQRKNEMKRRHFGGGDKQTAL